MMNTAASSKSVRSTRHGTGLERCESSDPTDLQIQGVTLAMGAMGKLTGDQRYVMTVEIPGPKTVADADKVNALVKELKDKFGATVTLSITGNK
jgi:hypothetical protein